MKLARPAHLISGKTASPGEKYDSFDKDLIVTAVRYHAYNTSSVRGHTLIMTLKVCESHEETVLPIYSFRLSWAFHWTVVRVYFHMCARKVRTGRELTCWQLPNAENNSMVGNLRCSSPPWRTVAVVWQKLYGQVGGWVQESSVEIIGGDDDKLYSGWPLRGEQKQTNE